MNFLQLMTCLGLTNHLFMIKVLLIKDTIASFKLTFSGHFVSIITANKKEAKSIVSIFQWTLIFTCQQSLTLYV